MATIAMATVIPITITSLCVCLYKPIEKESITNLCSIQKYIHLRSLFYDNYLFIRNLKIWGFLFPL